MDRREFVGGVLALGAAGGVSHGWQSSAASSDAAVAELHSSTLVVNGLDPSDLNEKYLSLLRAGGVSCWHQSVGDDMDSFARLFEFFDEHMTQIAPAGSVRQIRELRARGLIAHIAGWQSADALVVAGDIQPRNLRAYHQLGLRICGIAYNTANDFGGGCLDAQVGLTRAGQRLVEEIHRVGMVLDVGGHTGEQTSFDAIAISAGVPVICSHTNVRALNDNPRCTSDRLLEAIARTGGVIGLSAFNDFHARKSSDSDVPRTAQVDLVRHLEQYDYLKRLIGVEHIGLGPDFIEGRNHPGPLPPADRFVMAPEAYSQQMPWFYVKRFENIGELPNVTRGLLQRGWSVPEVRKVLGENWLRVYERVWGA